MNPVDVVARLQLRAEQFSSDTGRAFADLKVKAASAADDVRNSFTQSFAEVQRIASDALTFKRTDTGSLNLSGEIEQLRNRATLVEQNAQAARELSIALTNASAAAGVDAEALRREADAAAVSALAADRDAQALRDRAAALEIVQVELNQTISSTDKATAANARSMVSAGQHRQAMMSLGQQFGDFTVQVVSGQSAVIAFAQQFPQAIFAVQSMGGELGAIGAFLESGWGTAITIAIVALTPFVAKLFDASKAAEEAKKTEQDYAEFQQDLANYLDIANGKLRERMDLYARLKILEDEKTIKDKEAQVTDFAQQAFARARAGAATGQTTPTDPRIPQTQYDQQILAIINKANGNPAELAKGLADLAKTRPEIKDMVADVAKLVDQAAQARREADKLRGSTYALNTALQGGAVVTTEMIDRQVALKNATTDVEKAQAQLNIVKAREADINRMDPGPDKNKALKQYETDVNAATAALKRAQEAAKEARKDMAGATSSGALLRSAETYKGAAENTPSGRATLQTLFDQAGIHIDPQITAWCAAFVNAVLATNGLKGTGSNAAKSFLDYGTATNSPQKGDIVVSTRPGGGHVGFFEGFDKNGNVRVLGGNTGNKVAEETVNRANVLGYRRAPASPQDEETQAARAKKAADEFAAAQQRAADQVLRINAAWDTAPTLIDRARVETNKLNEIIAEYSDKEDDASKQIVDNAIAAKAAIADGINKPFNDFVRSQKESLAIQTLALQGRDVEAAAMQDILRIQQQQGQVSDKQIQQAYAYEAAQKRIAEALQDQQRILNITSNYVSSLQRDFDKFLADLDNGNRSAFPNLFKGWLEDFKQLRRDLISNAVFGGIDRDIQEYVRKLTGKQTPAEILAQQATDAGEVMKTAYDDAGGAVTDFGTAVRDAMDSIAGSRGLPEDLSGSALSTVTRIPSQAEIASLMAELGIPGVAANDNTAAQDIVITGIRTAADRQAKSADKMIDATDIWTRVSQDFVKNFAALGVDIPKSIADALPGALQGASIFSSIGAQFGGNGANIGGSLGAGLGLIPGLADYFSAAMPVYQIGQAIAQPIGQLLGFDKTNVAVGGLVGGLLGKIFGIGPKTNKGSAGIGFTNGVFGAVGATGTNSQRTSGASDMAGAVADQLQQIADQLGAQITGSTDVKIGTYKDKIRVNDHGGAIGGVKGSGAINFDTEQEAVAYAVTAALEDGVLSGISAASLKILQSGQNIDKAIQKALAIESIPHDLKAMLDPVGSAIDDLNKKWADTVAALNEGGATAEQMAQAQQLYNLQLDQVKASTQSASQSLKDFLTSLKVGSDSPYSLRDQEATALQQLQPFLDSIAAGKSIDQGKYQDAASQYLDIERQLYGSTQAYFDAMDLIQAATNKAIAAIDNAVPVTPGVPDPFTKATADNTQSVAQNTQTQNEMTEQTNDLLRELIDKITGNSDAAAFVNDARNFLLNKAA